MHHEPSRQDSQPAHLYACHHVAPHSSLITHHHLTQLAVDGAAGVDAYADGLPSAHETARATLQELRGGRPFTAECAGGCAERGFAEAVRTGAWSNSPLSSASVRLLRLLRARLAALGGSALPGGRDWATGRPATASGAQAGRLQSRRSHRLCKHPGSAAVQSQRASLGAWNRKAAARSPRAGLHTARRGSPAVKSDLELVEDLGAF